MGTKAALREAQAREAHATGALQAAQEAEARAREREEKANAAASTEQVAAKRIAAERDAAHRRLSRQMSGESPGKGAAGGGGDNMELEFYRAKVKCSLCRINDKDAIISKCMHSFCRECIQTRLEMRNRKCPACALQFDFQSVKDLFLTS